MAYTLVSQGIVLGETDLDMVRGTCGALRPTAAGEAALPTFRRLREALLWAEDTRDKSVVSAPPRPGARPSLDDVRRLLEPIRSVDVHGYADTIERFIEMDLALLDASGTPVAAGTIVVADRDGLCFLSPDERANQDRVYVLTSTPRPDPGAG